MMVNNKANSQPPNTYIRYRRIKRNRRPTVVDNCQRTTGGSLSPKIANTTRMTENTDKKRLLDCFDQSITVCWNLAPPIIRGFAEAPDILLLEVE